MGLILVESDFATGQLKVAQNKYNSGLALSDFILEYEKKYLVDLLGASLSTSFLADLTNKIPVTTKYLNIFNAFDIDNTTDNNAFYCVMPVISSIGLKEMLKGFVFWNYVAKTKVRQTQSGPVVNSIEVAREAGSPEVNLFRVYNRSVDTFNAITWYIKQNLDVYPTYNGIGYRKYTSFI